jgi:hypothetical protein
MVNRKVYGYDVPRYTPEEIEIRFGISKHDPVYETLSGPNCWILPFIGEEVNVLYVDVPTKTGTERITQRRITDAAYEKFGKRPWYDALHYAGLEVTGQVKNFLVALRTYSGDDSRKKVKVLLKGSKYSSESGAWIQSYGMFLASTHREVEIHCYDKGEIDGEEEFYIPYGQEESHLTIFHIGKFYEGRGEGFDVLVDDAFVQGSITMSPNTPYWSLKNPGTGTRFFSPTETRVFSHNLGSVKIKVTCHCPVCELLVTICTTFGQFHGLKGMLVSIGAPICDNMEFKGDQQAKSHLRMELHKFPSVLLAEPYQHRAAIALTDELPIKTVGGPLEIQKSSDRLERVFSSDFTHTVGFCSEYETIDYSHFSGKNVRFYGVDSNILGSTRLDMTQPCTILIGNHLDMLLHDPASEIWYPGDVIIGYTQQQETLGPFRRFTQNQRVGKKKSFFSDIGGIPLKGNVRAQMRTGGSYAVTQKQVTEFKLALSPPIAQLRGVFFDPPRGLRFVHGAMVKYRYPAVDTIFKVKIKKFIDGGEDCPIRAPGDNIRRGWVKYSRDRNTLDFLTYSVPGSRDFFYHHYPDGVVVEFGVDKAVEALKTGLQINPGPRHMFLGQYGPILVEYSYAHTMKGIRAIIADYINEPVPYLLKIKLQDGECHVMEDTMHCLGLYEEGWTLHYVIRGEAIGYMIGQVKQRLG